MTGEERVDEPSSRIRGLGGIARTLGRLVIDLVVVTIWVFVLIAVFLYTGWPWWSFYAMLVGVILLYVWLT